MNTPALQEKIVFAAPLHNEPEPALQWIELSSSLQLPGFQIVGLPGREITEARERVRAAIEASGFEFPRRRVVLNLSPASIRKQGTGLDLAMALSILFEEVNSANQISLNRPIRGGAWGELGLDGTLKPSGQILRTLVAARKAGLSFVLFGPEEPEHLERCLKLATLATQGRHPLPAIGRAETLADAYNWVLERGWIHSPWKRLPDDILTTQSHQPAPGSETVTDLLPLAPQMERTLGAAAAGGHHLLLLGARGTGKSHALEWLQAIQPRLDPPSLLDQKLLEELVPRPSTQITSETPSSNTTSNLGRPVVRRVGQQIRPAALIGRADSTGVRPGEFSLAHGGLLLADEFLEWDRDAREAFREPLERGSISLTRTWAQVEMPARFVFAATGNLCPCGGWPPRLHSQLRLEHPELRMRLPECVCHPRERQDYAARLSGPIFDRIDLVVRTPPLLPATGVADGSANLNPGAHALKRLTHLRNHCEQARAAMLRDLGARTGALTGERLENWLTRHPRLADSSILKNAQSLRSRHRILRVAIALSYWDDPSGKSPPEPRHLIEAASYRAEALGLGEH